MRKIIRFITIAFFIILCDSCSKEQNSPLSYTGESEIYKLKSVVEGEVADRISFIEFEDQSTEIIINITSSWKDNASTVELVTNTAVEGGITVFDLNPVDTNTGKSTTIIKIMDTNYIGTDNLGMSYSDLIEYDGHINVRDKNNNILAQGDIGQNKLTGTASITSLEDVMNYNVSGEVLYEERKNGETLVTIRLSSEFDHLPYFANIYENSAVEGGELIAILNPVNDITGVSQTNVTQYVSTFNDSPNQLISYNDFNFIDAHIELHQDLNTTGNPIIVGDIGQNTLTGNSSKYDLYGEDELNVTGEIEFLERRNKETLARLEQFNTIEGSFHPAHVHEGYANDTAFGIILFTLNPVNGTTGKSQTNIEAVNFNIPINYDELILLEAFCDVHLGPVEDYTTFLGIGNIGSNDY